MNLVVNEGYEASAIFNVWRGAVIVLRENANRECLIWFGISFDCALLRRVENPSQHRTLASSLKWKRLMDCIQTTSPLLHRAKLVWYIKHTYREREREIKDKSGSSSQWKRESDEHGKGVVLISWRYFQSGLIRLICTYCYRRWRNLRGLIWESVRGMAVNDGTGLF
jgi:hypothetical protein